MGSSQRNIILLALLCLFSGSGIARESMDAAAGCAEFNIHTTPAITYVTDEVIFLPFMVTDDVPVIIPADRGHAHLVTCTNRAQGIPKGGVS